ncbi:hypothetical protein [Sporosarcina koreensis]|uniref:DUF4129 domain-containing protein n=1 Tax=Sporosarcina koreensis TaxID=334735 RepID=A0ABW0TW03_9BACL
MGQERFEYERNRFNLSERLVAELFLLSYIFIFFLGERGSAIPYIWLLISIAAGIAAYFIFYSRAYSLGPGMGLALGVTVPLFLIGAPLMNILLFFVYIHWRIQANFSGSRIYGWPFITLVNPFAFFLTFFMARLIFANDRPEELMHQQLMIFLLTSFLFYFIRMITITINSRQLGNFKVREAGKVFIIIMGLGASVFFIVLTWLKPVRSLIIETMGYLFGGLFMLFLKGLDPLMEFIRKSTEKTGEENAGESGFRFFDFEERAATSSLFEYASIVFVTAVLIIIAVVLILKKKNERYNDRQHTYFFSFKGKRERKTEQRKMLYDYSTARDEVRKSFERFEEAARESKLNRSHEETIKEWFLRMGWEKHEHILAIYNAVRYGSHIPSESEQNTFFIGLENIKKDFLK